MILNFNSPEFSLVVWTLCIWMIWNMMESSRQVCVVVVVQRVSERWASELLWLFYLHFFSLFHRCVLSRECYVLCSSGASWGRLQVDLIYFSFHINVISRWFRVWVNSTVKIISKMSHDFPDIRLKFRLNFGRFCSLVFVSY